MKIAYLETSHDQIDIISMIAKAAADLGYDFVLILSNRKLLRFYEEIGCEKIIIDSANNFDGFLSQKAFFLECATRTFPFLVKKYSSSGVANIIRSVQADVILSFVGPEGVKYIFNRLCSRDPKVRFYFLDQVQSGNRTLSEQPFSVSGCAIGVTADPKEHIPHVYRPREKSINKTLLLRYSLLRFIEAVVSTFNRFLKSIVIKNFLNTSAILSDSDVILAPQGFTEASYTYSTLSLKSPITQLEEYSRTNGSEDYRWRLHPHNSNRISWSDLLILVRSNHKIEDFDIRMEDSVARCKYVVTLSSNIIYDSSLLGKPSMSLGRSVYRKNPNRLERMTNAEINFFKSLIGFEAREWTIDSILKMLKCL